VTQQETADVEQLLAEISDLRGALAMNKEAIKTLEARDALMLGVRNDLQAQLSNCERERVCWKEDAERFCRNESYYRGLLVKIGEMFGEPAYTSDDGSIQQDVLCAKVPELAALLLRDRGARTVALENALQRIVESPSACAAGSAIREAAKLLKHEPPKP